jgi:hypothetical protein
MSLNVWKEDVGQQNQISRFFPNLSVIKIKAKNLKSTMSTRYTYIDECPMSKSKRV